MIPEIRDLEAYHELREAVLGFGAPQFQVGGTIQAALRVLVTLRAKGLLLDDERSSCRVIAFGVVPWSSQQKTRVDLFTVVTGPAEHLKPFEVAENVFERPRLVRPKAKVGKEAPEPFWSVPQSPELIARNAADGQAWWKGLADFVATLEPQERKQIFISERGGLNGMVANAQAFPESPEKVFVHACHEAWRRRLGQLGERARDQNLVFADLARREFERTRVSFSHCKNAAMLRQTMTDFWARGGSQPALREGWVQILPFLSEARWRDGKDLALLALASYRPATKEEEKVFNAPEGAEHED